MRLVGHVRVDVRCRLKLGMTEKLLGEFHVAGFGIDHAACRLSFNPYAE